MATRKPPVDVNPAEEWSNACLTPDTAIEWQEYRCELVTPLFGGGIESRVVDEDMPVRAASIRGHLRWWWRLLAEHVWKLGDSAEIRRQEFAIWGGLDDNDPKASLVFLQAYDFKSVDVSPCQERNQKGRYVFIEELDALKYALFPAQSVDNQPPASLIMPGMRWVIKLGLASSLSDDQKLQVRNAFAWWVTWGGVGSRTRRGLGSFSVKGFDQLITKSEIDSAGFSCSVKASSGGSAMKALGVAIGKLSDFRQGVNVGRNAGKDPKKPGRSRWPEPDAMRRLYGTHSDGHKPLETTPEGSFPRAAFGLPIITKFNGANFGEPGFKEGPKPQQITLTPNGKERMASPLIVKAVATKEGWTPGALLLPYDTEFNFDLLMETQGEADIVLPGGGWWNPEHAKLISPMKGRGTDALQAFLKFF